MKLYCLGTTGYHPSQTRHTACYYIPQYGIVMDVGTGAFRLTEHLLQEPRESLDIFLSHVHLDHVFGLTFILDTLAVTSLKKVRVFGEREKLAALRQHMFAEPLFPVLPPVDFCALESDRGSLKLDNGTANGTVKVDWFPLEHPGGCLGFRFTFPNASRIAYVTDTVARPDADYLRYIEDVDLLLHECYFTDEFQEFAVKTGHSWLSAVHEVVRRARPRQTALIHVNPIGELLGKPIQLSAEQISLNMHIPNDGDGIDV